MAWVMMAPSEDMRVASHGGTRPPWRGRSALPVRRAILFLDCRNRSKLYQVFGAAMVRNVMEYPGASTAGLGEGLVKNANCSVKPAVPWIVVGLIPICGRLGLPREGGKPCARKSGAAETRSIHDQG